MMTRRLHDKVVRNMLPKLAETESDRVIVLQGVVPDAIMIDFDNRLIAAVELCNDEQNEGNKLYRAEEYKTAGYDMIRVLSTYREDDNDRLYSLNDVSKIDTFETNYAYIAGVLDNSGKFGMRMGQNQIEPCIYIYSNDISSLKSLEEFGWPFKPAVVVGRGKYALYVTGNARLKALLESTLPHIRKQKEIASLMLKFVESRCEHPAEKYTIWELQLVTKMIFLTSRNSNVLARRYDKVSQWRDKL